MEIETLKFKGSCHCGQCCYECIGELYDVMHCHCSNCRKLHGSPFTTYGGVAENQFSWFCDLTNIKEYKSSSHVVRCLCENCGSLLVSIDSREDNTLYLNLGLVDSNISIQPEYHQYVGSKVPWYRITDDIPQFESDYIK